jgi:hypothetical protein
VVSVWKREHVTTACVVLIVIFRGVLVCAQCERARSGPGPVGDDGRSETEVFELAEAAQSHSSSAALATINRVKLFRAS